jgi:peptidase M23-like protein
MAAPAIRAAGIALGSRSLLPRALIAAALALIGLLLLIALPLALLASLGGSDTGGAPAGIPAAFVPIYREAARAFGLDWLVLASIHDQETGFSTNPTTYRGLNSAACCAGPFQINLTNGPPSTWDTHKAAFRLGRRPASYPHPQTPHPSVYDDFDAAMAAGSLLRANGTDAGLDDSTYRAVRAYNGTGPAAEAYAQQVMTRARAWAQMPPPLDGGPGATGAVLTWPVRGPVTSRFCERRAWETCHPGIDIAVPSGTAILAAADGRVTLTQPPAQSGGYGNYTCLQHSAAVSTCYAHQARVLVHPGQLVTRGQQIGISDCTGRCYGPHLHFEVRLDGQPVCPARYLGVASSSICTPWAPGY